MVLSKAQKPKRAKASQEMVWGGRLGSFVSYLNDGIHAENQDRAAH
jgi:hypothetical protein